MLSHVWLRLVGVLMVMGFAMVAHGEPRSLKGVRFGKVTYVSLRDLADYYKLGADQSKAADRAEYRTSFAQLSVVSEKRDIVLNGVVHWLSMPIYESHDRLWISSLDILKIVDPVLRQARSAGKTPLRTIVLDPGHGGTDRGTRGVTGREKELTLDLSKRVKRLLEAAGMTVVLTRSRDETMELAERVEFAERKRADMFVSIHFNSGGSASGIETYCVPPAGAGSTSNPLRRLLGSSDDDACAGNRHDERNVWLAHCVQRNLLQATKANDRGVRRARFVVIRDATCPAILVEAGFLSNHTDEVEILDSDYREKLAKAIADGILEYKRTTE